MTLSQSKHGVERSGGSSAVLWLQHARACDTAISNDAEKVEADIAEAMRERGMQVNWIAQSLAFHMQSVLQGAFILAKAKSGAYVAVSSVDHLRWYSELLF